MLLSLHALFESKVLRATFALLSVLWWTGCARVRTPVGSSAPPPPGVAQPGPVPTAFVTASPPPATPAVLPPATNTATLTFSESTGTATLPLGTQTRATSGPAAPAEQTATVEFAAFPTRDPRNPNAVTRNPCGAYTIVREPDPTLQGERVSVVAPSGGSIQTFKPAAPSESFSVPWCADVTGDGNPELTILFSSGGAHCCFTTTVLSLGPRLSTLLVWEGGNVSDLQPRELDGHMPFELVGLDDRLAYYGGLPFAVSSFIPIVFSYRDGKYVRATREFPSVLREDRAEGARGVSACQGDEFCLQGTGLHLLADSLLLGDWDTYKGTVPLPPSVTAWLDQQRSAVQKVLEK